jgi:hypothetical protein
MLQGFIFNVTMRAAAAAPRCPYRKLNPVGVA